MESQFIRFQTHTHTHTPHIMYICMILYNYILVYSIPVRFITSSAKWPETNKNPRIFTIIPRLQHVPWRPWRADHEAAEPGQSLRAPTTGPAPVALNLMGFPINVLWENPTRSIPKVAGEIPKKSQASTHCSNVRPGVSGESYHLVMTNIAMV